MPAFADPAVFEGFLSRLLLSPVWYPPPRPDIEELGRRLELRLLARMWAEGYFAAGEETRKACDWARGVALTQTYVLDYDRLGDVHDSSLKGPFATRQARAAFKKAIRPLAEELSRPAPFAFGLPAHAQIYRDAVEACHETLAFGQIDPDFVLRKLPYRRLDWSHVPA